MPLHRTLPPAAAPLTATDLFRAFTSLVGQRDTLEALKAELRQFYGARQAFLLSSGKAAFALILRSLHSLSPRRKVVIPAYTCFSLPSVIVKCGLDIVLCDVDPETLDFDFDHLEEVLDDQTLCVVPTHLLGYPSDMDRVATLAGRVDAFVVEDAAQAMGGDYKGQPLGIVGDVGFFSLGRGKNITCGSGGVILTKDEGLAAVLQAAYDRLPAEPHSNGIEILASMAAMWLFIHPALYWLPSSLPFLHLGETFFCPDFPERRLSHVKASLLFCWRQRLEWSNRIRRRNAMELLTEIGLIEAADRMRDPVTPTPLRLPLLLGTPEAKKKLCHHSKREGLGISPLYPTAINAIPELAGRFEPDGYPGATTVASRLVTLPVHPLVSHSDIERIAKAGKAFSISVPRIACDRTAHTKAHALA